MASRRRHPIAFQYPVLNNSHAKDNSEIHERGWSTSSFYSDKIQNQMLITPILSVLISNIEITLTAGMGKFPIPAVNDSL